MLELEQARKYYESPGGAVHAVDDVTMTVAAQELVAIIGPSGSGKTTLLLLAAGLLKADSGSVRFEGRDLGTLSKREVLEYRRTQLGFVFQGFNLVPGMTAEENVAMPLLLRRVGHRDAHKRARAMLDEVGLSRRAEHAPSELSGGEQQRVAVARALVGEPKLILADEPTGNLDTETGDAVLQLLRTLPRAHGAAAVVVTHDSRVADDADRVVAIRDGRLTAPERSPQAIVDE
jgi:putative ABC transport system ATP-binding protein